MSAAVPISQTPAAAAKAYLDAGLVLIAFDKGKKGPDYTEWNTPKHFITTNAQASNLYGNMGLAHVPSRTCCFDIDDPNSAFLWFGERGLNLAKYTDASDAVRYRGQPGRWKILYRLPSNIAPPATVSRVANGFELRCAAGNGSTMQDVLPPSIHPKTQQPYEWIGPGTFRDIPEIPSELLELWQSLKAPRTANGTAAPRARTGAKQLGTIPQLSGFGHTELEKYLAMIDPATLPYGDASDRESLGWINVGMALHYETSGAPEGQAMWERWSFANGKNIKHNEANANFDGRYASFHLDRENPITLRSLEKLAGVNFIPASEYEALPPLPAALPHRLAFHPDATFLSRPPLKWYVPRVLPACEITMVYGASGSGKSFFVYDLVAAIAQGQDWCGRKTKKARIARIVAEGSAGDTNRVRAYASTNGGALPGLIECHARVDLLRPDGDYVEIGKQIQLAGGADIVVVDTLTAAAPSADQNNQKDMGTVIDHCRAIRDVTGAMIFWIHHSGKDPSKGSRGSSAIPAAVDCELEITALAHNRQAEITKLRDGETGAIFPFMLRQVVLGTDEDGEPITSCVVDHLPTEAERPRRVTSRQPQGANQKIVWKAFQELCGITGETTVGELCAVAAKSMTTTEGKRDTRPQRVRCAIEALGADDFLILDGETVRCI
jgi:hypothetical protein